ncbi:rhodanese-like domain-containing protein [Tellurirhabdus rosea]|uniref:rhodanese-like domain-containing protein n=1 Tax=Tellurirhabdus rosea TaxID=2674997 RepID=UPI002252B7E5|nr:rhodanese-like domain-containing protein [Tellurirhabdus rosea]
MDITVQELKERLDRGEKVNLIDVREDYEYDQDNLGGELIPLGDLPHRLDELEDRRDDEIIVQCRSGARSAKAQQILEQNGFSNVRNLVGGILAYRENERK